MNAYGSGYSAFLSQNPPPPPPTQGLPAGFNYGWGAPPTNLTPGMPGTGQYAPKSDTYPQWVPPPMGHQGGNFPKKSRGFRGGASNFGNGGRVHKRPFPQAKKPYDSVGKTPAMLLHELFKDIQEKYEEITSGSLKKYRCVLVVDGREFSMEANSKKIAKQKVSELVVRALRPDINVTPYEEATQISSQPSMKTECSLMLNNTNNNCSAPVSTPVQQKVTPVTVFHPVPPISVAAAPPPPKKAKLAAVDSALSLKDALRKICAERIAEGPFNPKFDYEDISPPEAGGFDIKKKFKCILTFPEQGRIFTFEGSGRTIPTDMALKEMFHVTDQQVRAIMRRNVLGKGKDQPIVQTLYTVTNACHCTIVFKIEEVEAAMGIGTGQRRGFICECTLTDHTRDDQVFCYKSEICSSKHESKENASLKALKEHFEIDRVNMVTENEAQPAPPCQQLQVLCAKTFKRNDAVSFEDLGSVGVQTQTGVGFKCKCIVNGREFFAIGNSKKTAKNAAAVQALNAIFTSGGEIIETPISELCQMIYTYINMEYGSLCSFYGVKPCSYVASFLLINEKNEKRLCSIAACSPFPIKTEAAVNAAGTCLYHYDPIVLARRSLVKYLMSELPNADDDPNSIFIRGADGMFRLKDNLRLVLYANYPPSVTFSHEMAADRCLSVLGPQGIEAVGCNVMSTEEVLSSPVIRVHSPADKIFKWTHLGVQGSLLSSIMHPILLDMIFFGSQSQIGDDALKHSFFNRIQPVTRPVVVESIKKVIDQQKSPPHVYCRGIKEIEILGDKGRTETGQPSRFCKAALYQDMLKLAPEMPPTTSYLTAKKRAVVYNESKKMLYSQLENSGYGVWQTKPAELVDFTFGPCE